MAVTDADARAAGFATPAGTDLISGGDNAIRQNARAALEAMLSAEFIKPYQGGGGDLNNLTTPGLHSYWDDWANRPPTTPDTSGSLFTLPVTDRGALIQFALPYGSAAGLYYRFYGSFWSQWTQLDAGAVEVPEVVLPAAAPSQSVTGFKTVPVALTVGGGIQNYPATQGGVRIPVNLSVPIKRWRLHIRNINPRQGEPGAGNVTISSVYIGRHGGNGTVSGGNTLVGGAMSSSSGSDMVTPWSSTEISAAYEYLISFGWTASQQPKQVVGGGYTTTTVDGAFNNSTPTTRSVNLPLDVWIEAEVEADVPVIAGFGDSLTSGVGAVLPVFNSWLSAYCRTHKALPVHYSASGDTMAGWSNGDHYKWTRWDRLTRPDAVVHAMGSNDVFGGASLATMQDRFRHTVDLLAEKVSPTVYAATIMPREGSAWDAMEQVRRDYNAWLAGRTRDLFDFVGAVSLDDETLIDSIDADGIHLTAAGYSQVAASITRPLTATALPDRLAALEYTSGWRALTADGPAVASSNTGNITIIRERSRVRLRINDVTLADPSAGLSLILTSIPQGFRPTKGRLFGLVGESGSSTSPHVALVNATWHLYIRRPAGHPWPPPTGGIDGELSWDTDQPLPTTLPGSPA